jgi:excisionase family DNA binding protein
MSTGYRTRRALPEPRSHLHPSPYTRSATISPLRASQTPSQTVHTGPAPGPFPETTVNGKEPSLPLKALYRIPEAMALLSMSRTVIYEQMRAGRLRSVKQGRSRLIPYTAISEYVALLESETARGVAA